MGLLKRGTALSYEATKKLYGYIRKDGVLQFINIYTKNLKRIDSFKWGDEVEYLLIKLNEKEERAQLFLKADQLLPYLQGREDGYESVESISWSPEFCEYQLEATPAHPYSHKTSDLLLVEENMSTRRKNLMEHLKRENGEMVLTMTVFPRLGCPRFTFPEYQPKPTPGYLESLFVPTEAVGVHPRFANFCRNIHGRRGEKPIVNMPVFIDKNTPRPFREDLSQYGDDGTSQQRALDDHVYFDTTALFGVCSLQVTLQGSNIMEARHLYDHMSCVTPIMLALSAASPILRGVMLDVDTRCDILTQAVDDRTKEELGLEGNGRRIAKSRYSSISSYLSPDGARYNDTQLELDQSSYHVMLKAGVDKLMAQHIAHLFIRDSCSMFAEHLNQDNESQMDLFENIQSTLWHNMRFKPPPLDPEIGWRVEFRPMEIQLTDFENAAFSVFVILLSRTILHFNLNFLIPISKADVNWDRAQRRDAVLQEKFYFRCNIATCGEDSVAHIEAGESCSCRTSDTANGGDEMMELSVDEIMNGKKDQFPGLIPLVKQYLGSLEDLDVDTAKTICQYLSLLQKRANGTLKTPATWIRDFVHSHPDYKNDSVVTERIHYDLVCECERISLGERMPLDFLPPRFMLTKNVQY